MEEVFQRVNDKFKKKMVDSFINLPVSLLTQIDKASSQTDKSVF